MRGGPSWRASRMAWRTGTTMGSSTSTGIHSPSSSNCRPGVRDGFVIVKYPGSVWDAMLRCSTLPSWCECTRERTLQNTRSGAVKRTLSTENRLALLRVRCKLHIKECRRSRQYPRTNEVRTVLRLVLPSDGWSLVLDLDIPHPQITHLIAFLPPVQSLHNARTLRSTFVRIPAKRSIFFPAGRTVPTAWDKRQLDYSGGGGAVRRRQGYSAGNMTIPVAAGQFRRR